MTKTIYLRLDAPDQLEPWQALEAARMVCPTTVDATDEVEGIRAQNNRLAQALFDLTSAMPKDEDDEA